MRVVASVFLGLALACPATVADAQDTSRETTTEIEHAPNIDGRMVPVRETVVEVIRAGTMVRTTTQTFGVGPSGQRVPLETREAIEEQPGQGRVRATNSIWRPDANGRLAIAERVEDETLTTPEGSRMERTVHRRDPNGQLRPAEHSEHVERSSGPQQVRSTTTESQVDVNSRWQVTEVRNRDTRTSGATEDSEETIRQRDLNGALWERQRTVSRATGQNGREDLVVEIFTDDGHAFGSLTRPSLSSRVRRTTTPRADGGHEIVEEVEERNPVAVDDPLRVVRRVVETTRRTSAAGWERERRVFARDPNNRLLLTTSEIDATP